MAYNAKNDPRRFTAIHQPMTGFNPLTEAQLDQLGENDVAIMAIEKTGMGSYVAVNFHETREVPCPRTYMQRNIVRNDTPHHLKYQLFYQCLQAEGGDTCRINVYPDLPLPQAIDLREKGKLPQGRKIYFINGTRKTHVNPYSLIRMPLLVTGR
jgi:hypothetical protein